MAVNGQVVCYCGRLLMDIEVDAAPGTWSLLRTPDGNCTLEQHVFPPASAAFVSLGIRVAEQ